MATPIALPISSNQIDQFILNVVFQPDMDSALVHRSPGE
jgi:hypothetical protein